VKSHFHFLEAFAKNRYTHLLAGVLLLLLLGPLLREIHFGWVSMLSLLVLLVILLTLWSLHLKKGLFTICVLLAVVGFFTDVFMGRGDLHAGVIAAGTFSLFLLIAIFVFIKRIFEEKNITLDTIEGGIAIYFLTGIFWALIYQSCLYFDSGFLSLAARHIVVSDLIYYSFVTMTTLGYGDITPIAPFARNLAILEAVFGQLYIAIFIARLIGLHLSAAKSVQGQRRI